MGRIAAGTAHGMGHRPSKALLAAVAPGGAPPPQGLPRREGETHRQSALPHLPLAQVQAQAPPSLYRIPERSLGRPLRLRRERKSALLPLPLLLSAAGRTMTYRRRCSVFSVVKIAFSRPVR